MIDRDFSELHLERELFVRALMPALRGDGAARLAALLELREVPADTVLFQRGEPVEWFFFVVEGQVVMEAEGIPSWTFGDRSLVGVLDMMAEHVHRRTCRTTLPTRLLAGRAEGWLTLLDEDAMLGQGAIYNFAERVHELSVRLGPRLAPEPVEVGPSLVTPLTIVERTLALRDTPLLGRASTQATASLAQVCEEAVLASGAELFAFDTAGRALYAVASGVIRLTHRSGAVQRVGRGRILAPAAALSGKLGEYAASAETGAVVLRIREEDYYDQSEEHLDLTRAALAYMAAELERWLDLEPPRE